jgi:hypothetical protein
MNNCDTLIHSFYGYALKRTREMVIIQTSHDPHTDVKKAG